MNFCLNLKHKIGGINKIKILNEKMFNFPEGKFSKIFIYPILKITDETKTNHTN
jgi:hypothetical protein